jgi:plastocyanin
MASMFRTTVTALRLMIALPLCVAAISPDLFSAAEQSSNASITGTVKLTTMKYSALPTSPYARRGVAAKPAPTGPELRNVVIFVDGARPATPPPPMRAKIAQRDEQFIPQVTVVTVGSTVDFPNDDPFFHNVFSLSRAATFDLGRYPSGASRSQTMKRTGIVKVFCHLHSQMTALIRVLDHPWFTIPAEDGTFTLPAVPAGELTVVAWHDRIGERREQIRVAPGARVSVAFTLPVLESVE